MEMKKYKLGEIAIFNAETIRKSDKFTEIEYLDTSSIQENNIGEIQVLDIESAPSRAQRKVKNDTIIYSTVRPNLKHYGIIKNPPRNFIVSTGFTTIDIKKDFKDTIFPEYLYMLLSQEYITNYLHGIAQNSVSSYPSINPSDIANLVFLFPDLPEQKRIAKVLTDIDSKIALNKKINKELETMAKELYDYWFVQFDFPRSVSGEPCLHELSRTDDGNARSDFPRSVSGEPCLHELSRTDDGNGKPYKSSGGKMVYNPILKREIPEGWEVKKLGEVLTIKNGKEHKNLTKGNYPVYGTGGIMRYVDQYLYSGESILLPRKGSLDNLLYVNDTFWTIDTIFYSEIKLKNGAKYLFYYIENSNYQKLESGTGRPSMTSSAYYSIDVLIPDEKTLEQFNKIAFGIEKKKSLVMKENARLQQLRDELLPMLMNGQVRVEE